MKVPLNHEVRAEVRAICKSERFARVSTGKRLLRYLVKTSLADPNRKPTIKGVTIGIDVFGLPADFDPKKNAIVKVTTRKLRQLLTEYYQNEGNRDRVLIEIPKGSYVPSIELNPAIAALDLDSRTLMMISQAQSDMDQRCWHAGLSEMYLWTALRTYPDHPRLLSLSAMFHAVKAGSYFFTAAQGEMREAESLIAKVRAQNAEPWECTLTDAWVNAALHWNWRKAGWLFERANALSSGEAGACQSWYASFLASQLRSEEAVAITQAALARSYDRTIIVADLALFQIIAGKLDEADASVRLIMQRVEVEKSEPVGFLAIAYRQAAFLNAALGDFDKAAAVLEKIPVDKLSHGMTFALQTLFLGLAGQRKKAREMYRKIQKKIFAAGPFHFAMAASGAGDDDEAVFWLKAAAEVRDPLMVLAAVLPVTRHLHNHAGFRSLVTETMKLPLPEVR